MPSESNTRQTAEDPNWDGHLRIYISQLSQDSSTMTSKVYVSGQLRNDNNWRVEHNADDIDRRISGHGGHHPGPFHFSLSPNGDWWEFIQHTFYIEHDSDGTKHVSFTVWYGQTDTETFLSNKSVSVGMWLTPIPLAHCARIRVGGKWVRAIPYVRSGGKWKKAEAYVRSGGSWHRAES